MPDELVDGESDMRRRAAWLLGTLILAAALVIVVVTTLLNSDKGSGGGGALAPDHITSTGPPSSVPTTRPARTTRTSSSAPTTTPATTVPAGAATCPSSATCALPGDVGNAIAAINAFRAQQGKAAVPGSVSDAAKDCALHRGNGCRGGWAETELPAPPDGATAVKQIAQYAKFLDPGMKSIEVGWAYDPGSKTYYFATIRQD